MQTVRTSPPPAPVHLDAPHSRDLIAAYLRHLTALGRAEATIDTYADLLCRLDRTLPEGLAYACTDELVDGICSFGPSSATRALYRAAAAGFFRWACDPDNPKLDYDPCRKVPRAPVRRGRARPVSNEVLADILARARQPMLTWYLLAAGNGLRCVEISRLDRERDVTEHTIWINGKGSKERVVPTHPAVWRAVCNLTPGPIARNRDGSHANRVQVQERGNYHLQHTLGHRGVSMHQLRHWHGTHVYQASGKDLRVAQELLGHALAATTQVYVAATADAKERAVAALALPGVN